MASPTRPAFRHWIIWAIALVAGSALIAHARLGGDEPPDRPRMEYLNQEVQADAVVESLNNLDKQGWDVVQIIPVWKLQEEGAGNTLVPKSYQVFGRRPVAR